MRTIPITFYCDNCSNNGEPCVYTVRLFRKDIDLKDGYRPAHCPTGAGEAKWETTNDLIKAGITPGHKRFINKKKMTTNV